MDLISCFTIITGVFSLVMSAGQMAVRGKNTGHYILCLFLLSVGVTQLYHGLMTAGLLLRWPFLALVHVPFLYSLGPISYFYMRYLFRDFVSVSRRDLVHLVPVFVLVAILVPFYAKESAFKREFLANPMIFRTGQGAALIYAVLIAGIMITVLCYFAVFFKKSMFMYYRREISVRSVVYFSHGIMAGIILTVLIYCTGLVSYNICHGSREFYYSLIEAVSVVGGLVIFMVYFMDRRYPDYFSFLREEIDSIRYQRSRIEGLDVSLIMERLHELMHKEKIFRVEDLTLSGLAYELDIAPYQLSQILNQNMECNFNSYINAFRVNDARELLLAEPERSISSVASAAGFSSQSAFYSWFCRLTGVSPGKYRDMNRHGLSGND